MSKKRQEQKSNMLSKSAGWAVALQDAEKRLREAQARVEELKLVVKVCRQRVANGDPWPSVATQAEMLHVPVAQSNRP